MFQHVPRDQCEVCQECDETAVELASDEGTDPKHSREGYVTNADIYIVSKK